MEANKEYTLEELEAQYRQIEASQKALKVQIEQKQKEEERLKQLKLAKDKDIRKKEVDEALQRYKTLLRAYMKDYGVYSYTSDEDVFDLFSSKFWNSIV